MSDHPRGLRLLAIPAILATVALATVIGCVREVTLSASDAPVADGTFTPDASADAQGFTADAPQSDASLADTPAADSAVD